MPIRPFGKDDLNNLTIDSTVAISTLRNTIALLPHSPNKVAGVIKESANGSDTSFSGDVSTHSIYPGSVEIYDDTVLVATDGVVRAASATVTITAFTELNTGDKVTLIATDGNSYDFTNGDQSSVSGTWESTGSDAQTATNLMNVINTGSGPAGARFTATVDGAVVTITQAVTGSSGNTVITLTDSGSAGMSKTDFTGGATGAGSGLLEGVGSFLATTPGTVDYDTSAVEVNFTTAPASGSSIFARFISLEIKTVPDGGRYVKGDVIFPNFTGDGLDDLFGFEEESINSFSVLNVGLNIEGETVSTPNINADGSVSASTSILYQVSTDNGVSWQYYDSGTSPNWSSGGADDSTFSTAQEIASGISALEWDVSTSKKQFRLKARLIPSSDSKEAPALLSANLYFEYVHFDLEEDIKRSLKSHLEDNLVVNEILKYNLTSASSVSLDVDEQATTLTYSNAKAFNLTDSPGRTRQLSTSLSGNTLTFTVAQTGVVEVIVDVTVPIFLSSGAFTQLSTSRALIVDISEVRTLAEFEGLPRRVTPGNDSPVREPVGYPVDSYRVRDYPSMVQITADLICQSTRERQALGMAAALRKMFDHYSVFRSIQTGDNYVRTIGGGKPAGSATEALSTLDDFDLGSGLSLKTTSMTFAGWAQDSSFGTIKSVKKVRISIGSTTLFDPTVRVDPEDITSKKDLDINSARPNDLNAS